MKLPGRAGEHRVRLVPGPPHTGLALPEPPQENVNPHDELQSLLDLFPEREPMLADAEHVASETLPEPYRRMLAHNHHMTVTMESYHGCKVDVRILDRRLDGEVYSRKIVLLKAASDRVVQFGVVRFDLSYVTPAVRSEILEGDKPLGRVLIDHNVLRHIDLGAVLRLRAGPSLARHLQMAEGGTTYGRLATIFCNRHAAVDLLEITAPLTPERAEAAGSIMESFEEPHTT